MATLHSKDERRTLSEAKKNDKKLAKVTVPEDVTSDDESKDSTESDEETEPDAMDEAILDTIKEHGMPEFDSDGNLDDSVLTQFIEQLKTAIEEVLEHAREIKRSPTYKTIHDTAKKLEQEQGYFPDEATCYAWYKRRFLLKDVINNAINKPEEEDQDSRSSDS